MPQVIGSYSSVPLDDEFDEEFMDQETQLPQNDDANNEEIQYESESPVHYCCKVPKMKPCNCGSLSKCSKSAKITIAVAILVLFKGCCIGLGYLSVFVLKPSPVLDKSYHAFSIPNHESSVNFDAFTLAAKNNVTHLGYYGKKKRSVRTNYQTSSFNYQSNEKESKHLKRKKRENYFPQWNDHPQWKVQWKLQVIFLADGDEEKNIFTKERLEYIHQIEWKIMNHTKFKDFCFKDYGIVGKDHALKTINNCAPLNSLMQYFYPTLDENNTSKLYYDGLGSRLADINSTIKFAMATSDHFYYFVDQNVNKTHHKSKLLRTEVLFGSPLQGYSSPYLQSKEQSEKYKEFVLSYIEMLSKASTDKVKVLYGGNEIFDYEVNHVFWSDVKLAAFSLAAIFVFMLILTSFSLWLTFFGIASILLCFPLAVFFYHTVFGVAAFGILNGVAAFVIIGIGVDDVFVFINIFRQATNMKTPEKRLKHTLVTAGKATFFTSFTTAAAFAANTASSIPAVHQFGLFMSLIVSCCWITVLVVMPPALYIWCVGGIQRWEEFCISKICRSCKIKARSLPDDIVEFVAGKSQGADVQVGRNVPTVEDDDDDVQLLTLDDPMEYYIERYGGDDDDEVLLIPDNTYYPEATTSDNVDPVKESSLVQMLQTVLYQYVALPVIRVRRYIIGFSIIILIVSIVLITRLHPSSKPPQLFKEDTNLQMLMDLKNSMGVIDEISCSKCSAIYDVHQSDKHSSSFLTSSRHRYVTPPFTSYPRTTIPAAVQPVTFKPIRPPEFEMRPMNKTVGIGKSVTFYCSAKGQPLPNISWLKDGKNVFSGRSVQRGDLFYKESVLRLENVKKEDEGIYTCVATNDGGQIQWSVRLTVIGSSKPVSTAQATTTTTAKMLNPYLHGKSSPAHPHVTASVGTPRSIPENYDMCKNRDCTKTKDRPMLETGATVYVVFGIDRLDRSGIEPGHVMDKNKGKVIFNTDFKKHFNLFGKHKEGMAQLCKICKEIALRTDLVKNGSAQCFPTKIPIMQSILYNIPECKDLPSPVKVFGRQAPAHVVGGLNKNRTAIVWWAFAFESTTSKSQSYFEAYKQYIKWEELISQIKDEFKRKSYLQNIFQTSAFWPEVMMEIVAVNSAIYSLVLSMVICLVAVAIFSGHVTLLLIVFITILEMICLVAGIFYLAGWEMGGVEAVSLSILVGSSVDYCVHLVESFLLAGKAVPEHLKQNHAGARQWRTKAAISHIGVSIFSSAMTTIVAAIPLTQTTIQPFSKFGQILAINSSVSIIYCLTVCSAFLAFMGPSRFVSRWKSTIKITVGTCVVLGLSTLALFVISKCGIFIPGPNGAALFPK